MSGVRNRALRVALLFIFLLALVPTAWASQEGLVPLTEIKEYVRDFYVEPVDQEVLEAKTAEELFEKLGDRYSGYMNPKEFEDFRMSSSQEYAGVGMQLEMQGDYLAVTKVFPNTPAEKVGVKVGDKIQAVNGEDMKGREQEEVVRLIRGTPGTSVLIQFLREGEAEPLIVSLTRELIHLEVLHYDFLEESIGYIRLDSFTPSAGDEFKKALTDLRNKGLRGLVFDVRQNPGGYLSSALDIGSIFTGIGEPLLHVVEREGSPVTYQSLTKALEIPLVVLVDGDSASASEIVAGIVQDSGAGWLVGTKTYGKASVQTLFPLSNGGAIKLTTARYLTPKKQDINGVGLLPDKIVEEPARQLEVAIEHLKEKLAKSPVVLVLASGQALWNGEEVALSPAPYQVQGQTLVPLRGVGELFGIHLDWDGTNNQLRASINDKELRLVPGENRVLVNGKEHHLELAPTLQEGRVFVPIRVLAEFLGASCQYDPQKGAVTITW